MINSWKKRLLLLFFLTYKELNLWSSLLFWMNGAVMALYPELIVHFRLLDLYTIEPFLYKLTAVTAHLMKPVKGALNAS